MIIKKYKTLTKEIKEIRTKVFIEEQGFVNEFEDLDYKINHLVMFDNKKPVGVCRYFFDKEKNIWIFGRLAIIKEYRGKNLGSQILKEAEEYIKKENGKEIHLHAQIAAKEFYLKSGYQICSKVDYDENCPHFWMKKEL